MKPGMDRGNKGTDRRTATSRTAKTETSRRMNPQAGKPATGRMPAQGGARGGDAQQRGGQGQQPGAPPADNKTTLYIGIGGGALVFAIILAFMVSGGGEPGGSGGGGPSADKIVTRAMNKATEAYQRGEYRTGLDIAEEALRDPKAKRSSSYRALENLAAALRKQVNMDRDAQVKVADFKKRIDAAVADQTAMAKAQGFWVECDQLMGEYGATTSMKLLKDIKEDLRRWVATESQGNWQKDYNVTKARIEKTFLGDQRFGEGIREWQRFGETSQDPLLHSRIEQEIRTVNQMAQGAAEKLVAEAGGGADARTKLEEGQQKFNGTDGQAVINKALKNLK